MPGTFDAESTADSQNDDIFSEAKESNPGWEVCVVTDIYPEKHTCAVITETGRYFGGVNWPGDGSRAPNRGDDYLLAYNAGKPVLVSAESKPQTGQTNTPYKVTLEEEIGGEDPAEQNKGFGLAHEKQPNDMLPGDWVKSGDLGQLMGVLRGGTTVMKASEIAQIIATQADHLLKLIGKNTSILTGGGVLKFKTEDGKSSIVLRTGSDEETETHPDVEDYRIRCELGDEGEMVDFRVTDRKGRVLYRSHVDSDGRVDQVQQQKVERTEGLKKEKVEGDKEETVEGQTTRQHRQSVNETIGGNFEKRVSGNARIKAAKNAALQALENLTISARKNIDCKVSGFVPGLDQGGPGTAAAFSVTNGNIDFDIGNPLNGDFFGGAQSDYNVNTYAGDMNFESLGGTFNVTTYRPGSVNLGGPAPGAFSGVLYETLRSVINLITTLFDAHVHQSTGPSSPTTPPVVPMSPSVTPLLPLMKSRFVSFGG